MKTFVKYLMFGFQYFIAILFTRPHKVKRETELLKQKYFH
jgi:hypothetical protein